MKMIDIATTRYSRVVKAFLDEYSDAQAFLNREVAETPVEVWCTNKYLRGLIDFELRHLGKVILSFHDDPENMLASIEQRPLVERLARERLLRFRMFGAESRRPGLWARLVGAIFTRNMAS